MRRPLDVDCQSSRGQGSRVRECVVAVRGVLFVAFEVRVSPEPASGCASRFGVARREGELGRDVSLFYVKTIIVEF
jgi:hypothetical protein